MNFQDLFSGWNAKRSGTVAQQVACTGKDQCQGVVGNRMVGVTLYIGHTNGPFPGSSQVDVIVAYSIPDNDFQMWHQGQFSKTYLSVPYQDTIE